MIDKAEAQAIAEEYIKGMEAKILFKLALLSDETIEFQLGWVFFYQSKEYIDTKNIMTAVGGNAPIIVNKFDRSLEVTGTGNAIELYIDEYVKTHI